MLKYGKVEMLHEFPLTKRLNQSQQCMQQHFLETNKAADNNQLTQFLAAGLGIRSS